MTAFSFKRSPCVLEEREEISFDEWQQSSRYRVTVPNTPRSEAPVGGARRYYRTRMSYIVTNAKPTPVTVDIAQGGLSSWWLSDARVTTESIVGTQQDAGTRRWEVPVPANGKTELVVTFVTAW